MNTGSGLLSSVTQKAGTARLHMLLATGPLLFGLRAWDITESTGRTPYEAEGILAPEKKRRRPVRAASVPATPPRPAAIIGPCWTWRWRPAAPTPWWRRECPPGLCLRRRSAGLGNPLAVAGGKPLFVRVPHLPRPAGGDLTQPAGASCGGCTSPARTIWAAWRKSPPWPRCATSTAPCCWWTTPMGLICGFCNPSLHPRIWAPICAAIPPTRPCTGAHRRGVSAPLPTAPAQLAPLAGALGAFGSTSPSYLTLASLDLCNRYLAEGYPRPLPA